MSTEAQKGRRTVAVAPGHFRVQQMWLRCPHAHPTPADAKTCDWSSEKGTTMNKITITIDANDVATLREVFFLAVRQSEAYVEESGDDPTQQAEQNQVLRLMSRIDAMLPGSTSFFD